jgi:hypothetical protein
MTASTAFTDLEFIFGGTVMLWFLDDISVNPVGVTDGNLAFVLKDHFLGRIIVGP